MNDNVTLRVNGREWNGWTSVRIGAGIERLARDFSVEITRQWPGDEGITTLQPRIKNGSIPALVLAATWFDNAARDADIIRRNAITHPGFVPVIPLKVSVQ